MLAVLRHPVYRRLFSAQILSLLGSGLTTVALALLAYRLGGERAGAVLGIALTLKMAVYVLFSPLAGELAARLPRKKLLIGLDLYRAALVLLLPLVDQIWQVYLLVTLFQFGSALFTPTFQALLPDVLPEEQDYARALSLARLAYDLESLLSPLLAGLLLSVVSFHWLFAGNGLGFLASALLVSAAALPPLRARNPADEAPLARRLGRGLRIYLATPRLRGLLALNVAVAAAGAMVIVNSVVYARENLGGDERLYTMLLAAYGLGSMLTALALPPLLDRTGPRGPMLAGGFTLALLTAVVATGPALPATLTLWALLGAANALATTPGGLLLRRSAQPDDRTALYAAQFALSHACWLFAYPLAGWLGVALGLPAAGLPVAALALAGALAAGRLWPASDPDELLHEHDGLDHEHLHVHDAHHRHTHEGWEGPEPHRHPHRHDRLRHRHPFVIDAHHPAWPYPCTPQHRAERPRR